jgi:hypothetical protein
MNESPEISLTEHQRYWLTHVRACEASGKRITEYAAENGIGVRAMYDGKRALVKKGVLPRTHATRFQRARVVDPAVSSEWRIQLPNGVSVAFAGPVDAGVLAAVLNTAATLG